MEVSGAAGCGCVRARTRLCAMVLAPLHRSRFHRTRRRVSGPCSMTRPTHAASSHVNSLPLMSSDVSALALMMPARASTNVYTAPHGRNAG